jgi:hypothetical protein
MYMSPWEFFIRNHFWDFMGELFLLSIVFIIGTFSLIILKSILYSPFTNRIWQVNIDTHIYLYMLYVKFNMYL